MDALHKANIMDSVAIHLERADAMIRDLADHDEDAELADVERRLMDVILKAKGISTKARAAGEAELKQTKAEIDADDAPADDGVVVPFPFGHGFH